MKRKSDNWEPRAFVTSLLLISFVLILVGAPGASAQTFTVSVGTNSPSYSGSQTIQVTGSVSPPPGNGTSATIAVYNPSSTLVRTDDVPVDGTTGEFSDSFVAGGTSWIGGTYTVKATWAPTITATPVTGTATFAYASTTSTTTATTTITSTVARTTTTTIALATYTMTVFQTITIAFTGTQPTTVASTTTQTTTTTVALTTYTSTTTQPSTITATVAQPTTVRSTVTQPTTFTQTRTQNRTITQATTQTETTAQPTTTTATKTTTSFSTTTKSTISNFSTYVILGAAAIVVLAVVAWAVLRGRGRREYWRVQR